MIMSFKQIWARIGFVPIESILSQLHSARRKYDFEDMANAHRSLVAAEADIPQAVQD